MTDPQQDTPGPAPRDEIERQLAAMLAEYHRATGDERRRLAAECMALVAILFDRELRAGLYRLFGDKTKAPGSAAYTAALGGLFQRVLDHGGRDPNWRARSKEDLRTWLSAALANQVRDALKVRRRRDGRRELHPLDDFASHRQQHFERKWAIDLECALQVLETWGEAGGSRATKARILHLHYFGGHKISEIAVEIGIDAKTVSNLKSDALGELREICRER